MGLGALFTLTEIARSNLKEKKLKKLLQDRGVDETIINQAVSALGYLSLGEKDKQNMYRKDPSLDREDLERTIKAVLLYIFQYLEVAELFTGNKEKALQVHSEAKAMQALIEAQKNAENEKPLSLSQVEARVVQFCIINYVDELTLSDEERKVLKEIADFIKTKTDPVLSQRNISLYISKDTLINLDFMLHVFMTDSKMASIYGSIGADSFIGDTGVRLSEMASYIPVMDEVLEKITKQEK